MKGAHEQMGWWMVYKGDGFAGRFKGWAKHGWAMETGRPVYGVQCDGKSSIPVYGFSLRLHCTPSTGPSIMSLMAVFFITTRTMGYLT